MNKEVSEIINSLCIKLGTSSKLLITELSKLRVAESIVLLTIFFVILVVSLCFLPKIWKYDHRVDGCYTHDFGDSCWSIIPAVAAVFFCFCVAMQIVKLVGWLVSPTAKAILEISNMIAKIG